MVVRWFDGSEQTSAAGGLTGMEQTAERTPVQKLQLFAIWLTASVALCLSTYTTFGPVPPWRFAPFYVSAILWSAACAFLQGYTLRAEDRTFGIALMWLLAGLTLIGALPESARWFDGNWFTDCRGGGFNLDLFMVVFGPLFALPNLGVHVPIFFTLILPTAAVLAHRHGSAFRADRNPLRIHWVWVMALLLCSVPLLGEHFLGVNW
jgi:hypothetical protein